jgi:hypothetical protein
MKEIKGVIQYIKILRVVRKVSEALLLFFIIFLSGLHISVNIAGKPIIVRELSRGLKRDVSVAYVNTSFPFNIIIKDVESKGLFKVSKIIVSPGFFSVFKKGIHLSFLKIIGPELSLARKTAPLIPAPTPELPQPTAEVPLATAETPSPPAEVLPPAVESALKDAEPALPAEPRPSSLSRVKVLLPRFIVKRLVVTDGTLNYTEYLPEDRQIKITLEKIELKADNFNFSGSGSQVTYFKFSSIVPWRESEEAGRIYAEGWVNLFKKDIQANLKVEDIDGVYLYPYYAQWVDLEKARIETAKLNLTSKIQGLDDQITAACHLELSDIVRKPRAPEEGKDKAEKIADIVFDMFKAMNQGKIALDFTVKTKLSSPQFGISDIKTAVETTLTKPRGTGFNPVSILFLPLKVLEGGVKASTEITRAMIEGSFAVGNELKDAVSGSFHKEPKETEETGK